MDSAHYTMGTSRTSFASFHVDVSYVAHSFFEHLHIKTAVHPDEDLPYLLGRILTLCHLACRDATFTEGLSNPKLPTIVTHDAIGNVSQWAQVGAVTAKKLKKALNMSPLPDTRVYFTSSEEVARFTHELRGSKQNWIKDANFFQFEDGFLEILAAEIGIASDWSVTFIDEAVYLNIDERDYHASLADIDIWNEYQKALQ